MDNDDIDVTKGCEIEVSISDRLDELKLNSAFQKPHILKYGKYNIKIFAGEGVGVVTKRGLKTQPPYPAINTTPLKALEKIFKKLVLDFKPFAYELYCTVGVVDGDEIAKQTANEKVGVIGGISILGTNGFVKPVSSAAYIDSIKTEIFFAKENNYKTLVFTIGNSAFKYAQNLSHSPFIIEIGNFVYDSLKLAKDYGFKDIILISKIAKMTKIAQNFKNTHNRFGEIRFEELKQISKKRLGLNIDIKETKTLRGIIEQLDKTAQAKFYDLINKEAKKSIKKWFKEIDIKTIIAP